MACSMGTVSLITLMLYLSHSTKGFKRRQRRLFCPSGIKKYAAMVKNLKQQPLGLSLWLCIIIYRP